MDGAYSGPVTGDKRPHWSSKLDREVFDVTEFQSALPQLSDAFFLTDGGIETTLIFHEGLELPDFAAFDLLRSAAGRAALTKYFRTYATIARSYGVGFILESATWRANPDWGRRLGYSDAQLAEANRAAVTLLRDIRAEYATPDAPMVISGCIGPRGDGYQPSAVMTAAEAEQYHAAQIAVFRQAGADMVTAITMNYAEEAIGIARAATRAVMPVAISFTVETDGRLPTGETLGEAIERVDAATESAPAYYMINCAHPSHFEHLLAAGAPWTARIRGIRANASAKSHEELNESAELDMGDPLAFGRHHRALLEKLPHLTVFGGCCGTDHRHVEAICQSILSERSSLPIQVP
jgi:S-methylmethionine-dependent homocysteine/selenocysteine methylase